MTKSAFWSDDMIKDLLKQVTEEAKKGGDCEGGFKGLWKNSIKQLN